MIREQTPRAVAVVLMTLFSLTDGTSQEIVLADIPHSYIPQRFYSLVITADEVRIKFFLNRSSKTRPDFPGLFFSLKLPSSLTEAHWEATIPYSPCLSKSAT